MNLTSGYPFFMFILIEINYNTTHIFLYKVPNVARPLDNNFYCLVQNSLHDPSNRIDQFNSKLSFCIFILFETGCARDIVRLELFY